MRHALASATAADPSCEEIAGIFGITEIEGGFPHSEILGSKLVRSSPRLIAAYHVLHRLSAPRHPPNALMALDRSHDRWPPLHATSHRQKDLDRKIEVLGTSPRMLPYGRTCRTHPRHHRTPQCPMADAFPLHDDKEPARQLKARRSIARTGPKPANFSSTATPSVTARISQRTDPSFPNPKRSGGARRDRTDDLMLAKHALSQLSYGPILACSQDGSSWPQAPAQPPAAWLHAPSGAAPVRACGATRRITLTAIPMIMVGLGRLERPTSPLSGVRSNHLSYRPADKRTHRKPPQAGHGKPRCVSVLKERETKAAAFRQRHVTVWRPSGPICSK